MPPIGAEDFDRIPDSAYSEDLGAPKANGHAKAEPMQQSAAVSRPPLNWEDLEGREPPPRNWIIPYWVPSACTTLLSGSGGIGKTLLAQHIATALATGYEFIEPLAGGRCCLMWAGEDAEDELWRRQIAISRHMGHSLSALTERFALHSFAGDDITLMAPVYGKLQTTPMLTLLREQVGDYRPQLVILDNVARLFGGSENERHGVTTFCAVVQGACAPAAVLLLGHPAKAQGSEYSGSTAWEGAVRARLYLSSRPPDAKEDEDGPPVDDSVRYLSRRKANYSPLDIRRFTLADGVLTPDRPEPAGAAIGISGEFAKDVVRRAVKKLAERQLYGVLAKSSGNYLPKMAAQYGLLDRMNSKQFAKVMSQMVMGGELAIEKIGVYPNRTPRMGIVHK